MGFTKMTQDVLNISKLPDNVKGNAKDLKATFDKAGEDIKKAHNKLVDELAEQNAASNIGAMSEEGATTVQAELDKLNERIKVDFTELEIDLDDELSLESENAVKNKVIAKEVNAVKGDLYAVDRYNKCKPELVPESEATIRTDNLFADMVQNTANYAKCSNRIVEVISDTTNASTSNKISYMFDGDDSTKFTTGSAKAHFTNFNFKYPVKINKLRNHWACSVNYKSVIKGSKNGKDYIVLYDEDVVANTNANSHKIELINTDYYKYYIWEIYSLTTASAFTYSMHALETTEWEGNFYNYTANLDIPLPSYDNNKIIRLEVESQKIDSIAYNIEDFSEQIIPAIDSSGAKYENDVLWTTSSYQVFDRSDSSYAEGTSGSNYTPFTMTLKSSSLYTVGIQPKKIRVRTSGAAGGSVYGTTLEGKNITLVSSVPQTSNNTPETFEFDVNTNEFFKSLAISVKPTSSTGGWKPQVYALEVLEGKIKKGLVNESYIVAYEDLKININDLGSRSIKETIYAGSKYDLLYDSVNEEFVLLNGNVVADYTVPSEVGSVEIKGLDLNRDFAYDVYIFNLDGYSRAQDYNLNMSLNGTSVYYDIAREGNYYNRTTINKIGVQTALVTDFATGVSGTPSRTSYTLSVNNLTSLKFVFANYEASTDKIYAGTRIVVMKRYSNSCV
jgi:hypothetical protein